MKHFDIIDAVLNELIEKYTLLFNYESVKPIEKDDFGLRYSKDILKPYSKPSEKQVGFIIDVKVGHIDHFKFYEEF